MLNENYTVSKSKTLIESKFPTWDAGTIDIFDTYLSRINPMDPESSEVVFTKAEYEKMIGVGKLRPEQLNKYVCQFQKNTVSIELKDEKGKKRGWRNYCLFDKSEVSKNELGEWEVKLRCQPELKQLFFDLKKDGFQAYRLKYTLNLTHKATKLLYFLLLDHRYGDWEWTVDLPELRERLGIDEKKYESFKEFNKFILKKSEEEINAKTDIKFSYEKIMRGRLTRAVKFKIEKPELEDPDVLPGQRNIYDYPEVIPDEEPNEENPAMKMYKFWSGACDDEFNVNQIKELSLLAKPHLEFTMLPEEHERMMFDYLRKKYVSLDNRNVKKSRYGMMKFIVENDC